MSYESLARWYDAFTADVPYAYFADFYEGLLRREDKKTHTLLDLCCGTGNLTLPLARRGYELIGVDRSGEMLSLAAEKIGVEGFPVPPLLLCQRAEELDLYGTVEGALCALDGLNYLPPETLEAVFRRLHLFIEPGGVFAFDIHAPEHLRELDGGVFVDETEDALCLWRGDFDEEENALVYGLDLFVRESENGLWRRESEEHVQYAHDPEMLAAALERSGFTAVTILRDGPQADMGRLFFRAVNLPH